MKITELLLTLATAVSAQYLGDLDLLKDLHRAVKLSEDAPVRARGSLEEMWGGEPAYSGVNTYAHFNSTKCLLHPEAQYDIGIIGVPFDTGTSYRPGARFGPRAIRAASQRQSTNRGWNPRAGYNPYLDWGKMMDCGDIPVTSINNEVALEQMTLGFDDLLTRRHSASNYTHPPRYVALGGDHSIILPHLRALHKMYGKIAVIHFDAHLDTWRADNREDYWASEKTVFTHGTMLWMAHEEGLLSDNYNVHVGLRAILMGKKGQDYEEDTKQGWIRFSADDVWDDGKHRMDNIAEIILKRIPKDYPVYISLDVDCMDPAFTPGTGTIEPAGMAPREVIRLLRKLDLNLVGGDVVEVAPEYDTAEITATNAAQVVFELITTMIHKGEPLPTIRELTE